MGGTPKLALARPGKTRSKKCPFRWTRSNFFFAPPNPATRGRERIYFARLPQTHFSSFLLHPQISPQSFLFLGKVPEQHSQCLPTRSLRFWACRYVLKYSYYQAGNAALCRSSGTKGAITPLKMPRSWISIDVRCISQCHLSSYRTSIACAAPYDRRWHDATKFQRLPPKCPVTPGHMC